MRSRLLRTLQETQGPKALKKHLGSLEWSVSPLEAEVAKSLGIEDTSNRRIARVWPGFDGVDLQDQVAVKKTLCESWPYFELNGNIDLEHLSKKGGENFKTYQAKLFAEGFELPQGMDLAAGRLYYEIGRPIAGSWDDQTCSFVAEFRQNHPPSDWFWRTCMEESPGLPWKPSVGGQARVIKKLFKNTDPTFQVDHWQEIGELTRFRWNNVAMTLEPVNHRVANIQIVSSSEGAQVRKGVTVSHEENTSLIDVLKSELLSHTQTVLDALIDLGATSVDTQLSVMASVSKALSLLELGEEGDLEIAKSMLPSLDSAKLEGAFAATTESLSDYGKARRVDEFYRAVVEGWSPIAKGWSPSGEESGGALVDFAEMFAREYPMTPEDALECASLLVFRMGAE